MGGVERINDRQLPTKSWGWEEWIVNNDLYCGKRLHFTDWQGATSLHFHARKHETMWVESGNFNITVIETDTATEVTHYLMAGDSIVIPPFTPHRIRAMSAPAVLVEFSTHHEDSDSYRIEK